jgi:hypothetical protein
MKPYVESFNLMGENVNAIRKRAAALLLADKEDRLEANYEDAGYMLLSRQQNAGQNHNMKTTNKSFQNVATFKYYGTTLANGNYFNEEISSTLNSGNDCYHSV